MVGRAARRPHPGIPRAAERRAARFAAFAVVAAFALVPLAVAIASPLQASRDPAWAIGGLAGVVALVLLFVQPVLVGGLLPGLPALVARRWHRWLGVAVVTAVLLHVAGLYLTSPEDIVDALLLRSPTPFAVYGVASLAGVAAIAVLASFRSRLRLAAWRLVHLALAIVVVATGVAHAVLIEGVMGEASKWILCGVLVLATGAAAVRTVRSGAGPSGRARPT